MQLQDFCREFLEILRHLLRIIALYLFFGVRQSAKQLFNAEQNILKKLKKSVKVEDAIKKL